MQGIVIRGDVRMLLTIVSFLPSSAWPSARFQKAPAAHPKAKIRVKSAEKKTMLVRSEQMVKIVVIIARER